ncbi:MAG: hypothetical protein UT39_C0001G0076 [Candidatus Woesebacteria bacterium GW2011_GWA1_39_21]|uniref:Uncharacterized protein n=1 Tax=Candidatus Woesebacteria bacterium GW2011_GWA1_39_21 TaxID=1618550 RepID=A0A0G0NGR9_9BACT|nr:MAG: hypothetical protein UT39_C0001G0076 [Candidatus Woesebacteria bacterium GW2011_GWA1_39_21]
MSERLAKGDRTHIRDLKRQRLLEEVRVVRAIVLQKRLDQSWEDGLNDSLRSQGYKDGVGTLSPDEKSAIGEYYELTQRLRKQLYDGEIARKDVAEKTHDFNVKHAPLFPDVEDKNGEMQTPFILSLRFITQKYRGEK